MSGQYTAEAFMTKLLESVDIETPEEFGVGNLDVVEFNRVIGGKRYDSSKMEQVSGYTYLPDNNDSVWMEETLWQATRDTWLLAGHGAYCTVWSPPDAPHRGYWGRAYIPLTEDQARRWCEVRNRDEALIDYFKIQHAVRGLLEIIRL